MFSLATWISGLGLGSMYGLMALGFYLTYAVSGTVNFAQGHQPVHAAQSQAADPCRE